MTEEFHLYLMDHGLGFTIAGGTDCPNDQGETDIVIRRVDADGAAMKAGLRVCDKLISVNGTSLVNVSHEQAVTIIKEAIPSMRLAIIIDRPTTELDTVACNQQFDRLSAARKAYKAHDEELSKLAHDLGTSPELHQTEAGQYVKALVFGGLDGIVTTFAVVASVAGANLSTGVVIIMGFANLIADGLSMGMGEYLSGLSEKQYAVSERRREEWEFDCNMEGEVKEMVDIYVEKGFEEEEARTIMNIMKRHKEFFIDHMMVQELGLMAPDEEDSPAKSGLVMFLSFLCFGLIPVFSYIALSTVNFGSHKSDALFGVSCGMTAVALFILGAVKSRWSLQSWYASGFSVLINGSISAGAAYLIGLALEHLVNLNNCSQMLITQR